MTTMEKDAWDSEIEEETSQHEEPSGKGKDNDEQEKEQEKYHDKEETRE